MPEIIRCMKASSPVRDDIHIASEVNARCFALAYIYLDVHMQLTRTHPKLNRYIQLVDLLMKLLALMVYLRIQYLYSDATAHRGIKTGRSFWPLVVCLRASRPLDSHLPSPSLSPPHLARLDDSD